ncbi:MAG TPA: LysM peptidoglycan-binding domain-containing protein, partial [Candidatus Marinimicrobia bacterium]|nr:LysM peptidoglycan-binding domain-containing protein [Candidatus Neomarinimicrobiota bacterium]
MIKFSRNRNIGIIVLLLLFGCGKKEKEVVLIERDGVTYEQGAQKPYSGKMSSKYNNGNMKTEGEYKDGLPVGTWKFWDRDGTEYTGAVSKYVFHEIQSGETLKSIANNFEVDVDQLYELNEDIDNDTGDKIKAGQVIGVKTADDADGQFLFWYDKQRIKIKSHKVFINGKRNGKWTFWNENGNIVRTGSYAAGKRDGSYAYYFNDGSKKEEGAWKNDQRDGLWVKYSNNGNTQKEGTYSNGKKDGVWTTWNDKGLMASKYLYENNKVIDKWVFKYQFYSNGNEKTLKSTRNNKLDGEQTIWHQNGQMKSIGNYTTGKENGDFQEWYENGQMQSTVNYLNGNMDGAYSEWFDNGQIRQQGSYVDNEFYLTTRWNNEGGILIKDGNGKWVGKNAEGRKLWAKEYQDGRLISDWEYKYEYFDNGQIKKESSFQGGQEDGESTIFFENGKTREEGTWKEGEYLITNRWNKNGNQIIKDGQGKISGKNKEG